jgi:hypothetical protein
MTRPSREGPNAACTNERRGPSERRGNPLRALFYGSLKPRRRTLRRDGDARFSMLDWHQSRWLAVAMLILILSCADAIFTLTLLANGAYEENPIMASLLSGTGRWFAFAKIGLTSGGVMVLTAFARMRAFGRIPVGGVLYLVLIGYVMLVAYEYWLCDHHVFGP